MPNHTALDRTLAIHPAVEMAVRHVYWRGQRMGGVLSKVRRPKAKPAPAEAGRPVDFAAILRHLSDRGVVAGSLAVVHSAYGPLKASGLGPAQVVEALLTHLGPDGTLVMPVIRKYDECGDERELLTKDVSQIVSTFDVNDDRTVWTGAIPKALAKKPGVVRSRSPLNSTVAIGPLATAMMADNLTPAQIYPCGEGSVWKFCADRDAFVVSIGCDLTHSLTMIHVAEDMLGQSWYVKNWYRERHFRIIDGDFAVNKTIFERHPKWGALHYAERTLCRDLISSGVMHSAVIDGVVVEVLRAGRLIAFLNQRNRNGYPYFWVRPHLR